MTPPARRPVALGVLVVVVALGLLVQLWRGPAWSDALGTVLYAAAVYLVLALVRPRTTPLVLGVVTLTLCVAVELAQLTGLPARVPQLRLVLGSGFACADLPWYAVGAGMAALGDRLARRRQRVS